MLEIHSGRELLDGVEYVPETEFGIPQDSDSLAGCALKNPTSQHGSMREVTLHSEHFYDAVLQMHSAQNREFLGCIEFSHQVHVRSGMSISTRHRTE